PGCIIIHTESLGGQPAPHNAPLAAQLNEGHPAFGKSAVDGRATAYVCRNQTCGLPLFEPDDLRKELIGR
ncbi:MAG: hypothetical protein KAI73_00205, partial [Rhodospirillaceae bacterium]|nr:hypothetical protein [Rhodospirillaceae bacterium]